MYTGETPIWKSEQRYLTVRTVLTKPLSGIDVAVANDSAGFNKANIMPGPIMDKSRIVRINGRMIAVDMNGDGRDDLVVAKNTPENLMGEQKGGGLEVLVWNSNRLEPLWSVKDLASPVFDVEVTRLEQGRPQVSGLVTVSGGLFGKDKARVRRHCAGPPRASGWGAARFIFTRETYTLVRRKMAPDGLMAAQSGSAGVAGRLMPDIYCTLKDVYSEVLPYVAFVSSYMDLYGFHVAGGQGFAWPGAEEIAARLARRNLTGLRWFGPDYAPCIARLTVYLRDRLEKEGRLLTDPRPFGPRPGERLFF